MDFSKVRVVDGSVRSGFEELCVQLSAGISGSALTAVERVEGSGGDGGVELTATTQAGRRIGIQAKYFARGLAASQWSQIERSLTEAMVNHPELTDYFVCTSVDRNPTQSTKWNSLITKWKRAHRRLTVHWTGRHELTGLLVLPAWQHLAIYYLDAPEFTLGAAARHTEIAIAQLHRRFTPRLHNKTSTEQNLARMIALPAARDEHRDRCREAVDQALGLVQQIREAGWPSTLPALTSAAASALAACQKVIDNIASGELLEQAASFANELVEGTTLLRTLAAEASAEVAARQRHTSVDNTGQNPSGVGEAADELAAKLVVIHRTMELFSEGQDSPCWIVTGAGGMGKSHLLATIARQAISEGRVTLMFLGERFQDSRSLTSQICEQFGWSRPFDDLLACMRARAEELKRPSLLIVDAVNETPNRGIWKTHLLSLQAEVARFPGVRLLVSCREDWLTACVPEPLLSTAPKIHHAGYDLDFAQAVAAYFDGYDVTTDRYPPLLPEFHSPLFLKTVCETYQGRRLPDHPLSFLDVLTAWEARISEEIQNSIDCSQAATQAAIAGIVDAMALADSAYLDADAARRICESAFPVYQVQRSLYRQLQSQGFMEEVPQGGSVKVRLQYERFYDVKVAQAEVRRCKNAAEWRAHWDSDLVSRIASDSGEGVSYSKLFAYALLVPEHFGIELVELSMPTPEFDDWNPGEDSVWDAWIDALPWRQFPDEHAKIRRLFTSWSSRQGSPNRGYDELFNLAYIEAHPLNADYLHEQLSTQDMPTREMNWTASLGPALTDSGGVDLDGLIGWCDSAGSKCSAEQARLAGTLLLWLTSTTNWSQRDHVTRAAIRLLSGRGQVAQALFDRFWQLDEPYVEERLLAVMAGVAPTLGHFELTSLATTVCTAFFATGDVPLNMMQRDYARFLAKFARHQGVLADDLWVRCEPPYRSAPLNIWTEEQVEPFESDPAYRAITRSIAPEEMGPAAYGDFGRYVMGGKVKQFVNPHGASSTGTRGTAEFPREDARLARRYVWSRIDQMGWTPERFSDFEERGFSGNRHQRAQVERISKKFQWIGYFEYIGFLMDHRLYLPWSADDGTADVLASELLMRDFDPSSVTFADRQPNSPDTRDQVGTNVYSVPTMRSIGERNSWVAADFDSFIPHLHLQLDGAPRLTLTAHVSFSDEQPFGRVSVLSERTSQWVDVRSFIVSIDDVERLASRLAGQDFWGKGVDLPRAFDCWLAEYPWHPMLESVNAACGAGEPWLSADIGFQVLGTACALESEERRFVLPSPGVLAGMSRSSVGALSAPRFSAGPGYRIDDQSGAAVMWGTTTNKETLLAADFSKVLTWLTETRRAILWCCLSEKRISHDAESLSRDSSQSSVVYLKPGDGPVELRGRRHDWPTSSRLAKAARTRLG